jgi:23S rRNA pseudouridine2605 synthase
LSQNDTGERLQKVLARAGVASRRKCEDLIRQGRVQVNGQVVTELGTRVDPRQDQVRVDGQPVEAEPLVYIAVHKPKGILSILDDPRGQPDLRSIVDLPVRIFPVGRLDADSEGLLLLTNDGDLAHRLTHPRFEHSKEYHVLVYGQPGQSSLQAWRDGIMLEDGRSARAEVGVLQQEEDTTWLRVVLIEGRKRQIRRVAAVLGHPVLELIRVRLGSLRLGNLPPGQWRYLTNQEVQALKQGRGRPKRPGRGRGRRRLRPRGRRR